MGKRGPKPLYTAAERAIRERAAQRRYRQKHRLRLNEEERQRNAKDPERRKAIYRKHRYGIEQHEYDALLLEQQSRCAICSRDLPLSIDHDHSIEMVRGLLCRACNLGLGNFEDDIGRLQSAIEYLRVWGERHLSHGDPILRLPK